MKLTFTIILILIIPSLFLACTTKPPAYMQEQNPSKVNPELNTLRTTKDDADTKWKNVREAARKEGTLILYTVVQPTVRQVMVENFERMAGIKVEIVTGRGGEISTKLLNERRAGLYLGDVYLGGTTTIFTQLKPAGVLSPVLPALFLPEVVNSKLWYKGVLPFMDKEQLVLQTRYNAGASMMDVAFSLKEVKKEELTSWYDLLKPKYKGRMNLQDPTTAGKGGKFINKALTYFGLDWDYMKALAKQEPVVTRDQRIMIEWVVKGKHIIAINPHNEQFEIFKEAGAEINQTIFKETKDILGGGDYNIAMIDKPSHPNAAKLFANWFLSKEGQTAIIRAARTQSAREDTPTDHLTEDRIRKIGVDYPVETEEFILNEEKLRPITIQIFGHLIQ